MSEQQHPCVLAPDHASLAEAVHGMLGRLLVLEARVAEAENGTVRGWFASPETQAAEIAALRRDRDQWQARAESAERQAETPWRDRILAAIGELPPEWDVDGHALDQVVGRCVEVLRRRAEAAERKLADVRRLCGEGEEQGDPSSGPGRGGE